jgi:hypothetical protein
MEKVRFGDRRITERCTEIEKERARWIKIYEENDSKTKLRNEQRGRGGKLNRCILYVDS